MGASLSLSISQNSQSVANNTSNITVKVIIKWTYGSFNLDNKSGYVKINGTKYSFSKPFNTGRTTSGSATLYSKSVNISHNSDGKKTVSCSASYTTGVSSGTITASGSKTLTTIPRMSTLSVSNGTLGVKQTLTVSRKSSSITHTIVAKCGSSSSTICSKSTDTTPDFIPPISWASNNTSGTSVSVTYTITSYYGSTNLGSYSYSKSCAIPTNIKPSCSITLSDPTGYLEKYGGYVKTKSKVQVVTSTTISYNSPIASYYISANGVTYSSSDITTDYLKTSGSNVISAYVKDKRGRVSETVTKSINVLEYNNPILSVVSNRCDSDGTINEQGAYVKVLFNGRTTSLSDMNKALYILKYKKSTETDYVEVPLSEYENVHDVVDGFYIFEADTGSTYDVLLYLEDNFSSVNVKNTIPTGFTLLHWNANGDGIGLGKMSEGPGIEFGMDTIYSNNKNIYSKSSDSKQLSLLYLSPDNDTVIGYGGYDKNIGYTNIYGNKITINNKDGVLNLNGNGKSRIDFPNGAQIGMNVINDDYKDDLYIHTPGYVAIGGSASTSNGRLYLYQDHINYNASIIRIKNVPIPYYIRSFTISLGTHSANWGGSLNLKTSYLRGIIGWDANGTGMSQVNILALKRESDTSIYLQVQCPLATSSTSAIIVYTLHYQ